MSKIYNKSIFIYRRDYRLQDNIGLLKALEKSAFVIPIFIFTPEQVTNNPYKSDNAVQFMVESLEELDKELKKKGSKLYYFYGKPAAVIKKLLGNKDIDAVFVNRDYTPYSKKRDESIQLVCEKSKKIFESYEDYLLHPVGSIRTGSGNVYSKFTPYFNTAKKHKVDKPQKNNYSNYFKGNISGQYTGSKSKFYEENKNIAVHGGRDNALKILANLKQFKKYNTERDILSKQTTRLSAYIKFGCVSIREVYHKFKDELGSGNDLIKQLYWREFYYNITEFHPNILDDDWRKKNFKDNYKKVPWLTYKTASDSHKKQFEAWKRGETGYPVIDSAIKELISSGFMHNRGRLIVGSFLIKNLFFHWAEGEKFFSHYLVDLDLPNNTNNWLWLSSAGSDSQPFFRTFSPVSQSQRFDSDCIYIKKWIPELKDVPNEHIHEWYKYYHLYPNIKYPKPIVDYSSTAKKVIEKYKKALY